RAAVRAAKRLRIVMCPSRDGAGPTTRFLPGCETGRPRRTARPQNPARRGDGPAPRRSEAGVDERQPAERWRVVGRVVEQSDLDAAQHLRRVEDADADAALDAAHLVVDTDRAAGEVGRAVHGDGRRKAFDPSRTDAVAAE